MKKIEWNVGDYYLYTGPYDGSKEIGQLVSKITDNGPEGFKNTVPNQNDDKLYFIIQYDLDRNCKKLTLEEYTALLLEM